MTKKQGNIKFEDVLLFLFFVCGVLGTIAFVMHFTRKPCATSTPSGSPSAPADPAKSKAPAEHYSEIVEANKLWYPQQACVTDNSCTKEDATAAKKATADKVCDCQSWDGTNYTSGAPTAGTKFKADSTSTSPLPLKYCYTTCTQEQLRDKYKDQTITAYDANTGSAGGGTSQSKAMYSQDTPTGASAPKSWYYTPNV